jgi:hypothetical protein
MERHEYSIAPFNPALTDTTDNMLSRDKGRYDHQVAGGAAAGPTGAARAAQSVSHVTMLTGPGWARQPARRAVSARERPGTVPPFVEPGPGPARVRGAERRGAGREGHVPRPLKPKTSHTTKGILCSSRPPRRTVTSGSSRPRREHI